MKNCAISLFSFFFLLLFPIISSATVVDKGNNFLVISDIHLDQGSTRAMDISPLKVDRNNDLDYPTFEKLISEVAGNIRNGTIAQPKFILILGDVAGHTRSSSTSAFESEATVFKVLKDSFPDTPILYTFGNNDSLKINYGPFTDSDSGEYKNPYDIAKFAGGWSNGFLSTGTMCENKNHYPCIIIEDTTNGYYSAYLESGLRLISLNTVLFSVNRKTNEQQAMIELQWLDSQLETAKNNQESVLITMHIPPGSSIHDHVNFWWPKEQNIFLSLVNKYHHTITGLLASHTHVEELRVIKDASQTTIAGVYLVPGLSTSHGNEPAIKTFNLAKDNEQWQLTNYEVFHFSAENSNLLFTKLYDYTSYYCNNSEGMLLQCLNNISPDKIDKYLAAGNKNYAGGLVKSLKDIILITPE